MPKSTKKAKLPPLPSNQSQQKVAKGMGLLTGHFAKKRKKGRPKRDVVADEYFKSHDDNKANKVVELPKKKQRGSYREYPPHVLEEVVQAKVEGRLPDFEDVTDDAIASTIPESTVRRYVANAKNEMEPMPHATHTSGSLLGAEDLQVLKDCLKSRDLQNKGMSRKETISTIAFMAQSNNLKKCEDHLDYLIRAGKLDEFKNGGRVVTAQKTTTKRGEVTVEQQMRWHLTVDEALEFLANNNTDDDNTYATFQKVKKHFVGNLDEACILSNDGSVKVISSKERW